MECAECVTDIFTIFALLRVYVRQIPPLFFPAVRAVQLYRIPHMQEFLQRLVWLHAPLLFSRIAGRHRNERMELSKNFSFWTVPLDLDAMLKIKSLLYKDLILNSQGCRKSNQLLRHPLAY